MDATPDFWTPQELTKEEINKICTWLMIWQAAMVTADSVMSDYCELAEEMPTSKIDPAFLRAMSYVEALVRHLRALKEK